MWIGLRKHNRVWWWNDQTKAEVNSIHWDNGSNPDGNNNCAFVWRRTGFSQDIACTPRSGKPEGGLCEAENPLKQTTP